MIKKGIRTILVTVFACTASVSYCSVSEWMYTQNDRDQQNYHTNYSYRDNLSLFSPSRFGNFSITARTDFLNNPLYRDVRWTWNKNETYTQNLNTFVAPDINPSDYCGFKIINNATWEQYSFTTQMYEPQKFAHVVTDKKSMPAQFDMFTARGNWIVHEQATNIQYNAHETHCPTSMTLRTYDIANNVFTQRIDAIVYEKSSDYNRYQDVLDMSSRNMEKTEYYNFAQVHEGISKYPAPPQYVPTAFTLTTQDPKGTITTIAFTHVQWKSDRVIGFDAVVQSNNASTKISVAPIFSTEQKQIGITVTVTDATGSRNMTWNIDDKTPFCDFARNITTGVNPLDIMGSSRVQMGDAKVAFLGKEYTPIGLLENRKTSIVYEKETTNGKFDTFIEKSKQFIGMLTDVISSPKVRYTSQIQKEYNVRLLESNEQWTKEEMTIVKNTFKELPHLYHGKSSLKFLIRESVYINPQGIAKPTTTGLYDGYIQSVYIYNSAHQPYDFPTSEKQFKGNLIHELTHAIQSYDTKTGKRYLDPWDNPLVKTYANITGWNSAKCYDFSGNSAAIPTDYGKKNVFEDMAESSMFYVLNPNYLKKISPERYDFFRDKIFGGKKF